MIAFSGTSDYSLTRKKYYTHSDYSLTRRRDYIHELIFRVRTGHDDTSSILKALQELRRELLESREEMMEKAGERTRAEWEMTEQYGALRVLVQLLDPAALPWTFLHLAHVDAQYKDWIDTATRLFEGELAMMVAAGLAPWGDWFIDMTRMTNGNRRLSPNSILWRRRVSSLWKQPLGGWQRVEDSVVSRRTSLYDVGIRKSESFDGVKVSGADVD